MQFYFVFANWLSFNYWLINFNDPFLGGVKGGRRTHQHCNFSSKQTINQSLSKSNRLKSVSHLILLNSICFGLKLVTPNTQIYMYHIYASIVHMSSGPTPYARRFLVGWPKSLYAFSFIFCFCSCLFTLHFFLADIMGIFYSVALFFFCYKRKQITFFFWIDLGGDGISGMYNNNNEITTNFRFANLIGVVVLFMLLSCN